VNAAEAAATEPVSAATSTVAAASAMATAAADFNRQAAIDAVRAGNAGIDWRQRFGALACRGRKDQ